MNHIPHTNHLVVGTEIDRKLYFFDINSPTDIPYNIIDLNEHSATTSEIFHLRGWAKSDYVSVGFDDGTVEVYRSSRAERVWHDKPDTRHIFRVTMEKDNDSYMLAMSNGWLPDAPDPFVWTPVSTANSNTVYIYRREPLKCDLKSHTLGYESEDGTGTPVCKLCFRDSFSQENKYLCS
jgi:WD40 repeat protein